jgi:hypothetical protein
MPFGILETKPYICAGAGDIVSAMANAGCADFEGPGPIGEEVLEKAGVLFYFALYEVENSFAGRLHVFCILNGATCKANLIIVFVGSVAGSARVFRLCFGLIAD